MNYYNDNDPYVVAWLKELMAARVIPQGHIDDRSITEVQPHDLRGYTQHHFFAGIGGWSLALQIAGWPINKPVCTVSCPCPPFSSAGKKKSCPGCGGKNPIPCPQRTGYFICCHCEHAWLADSRHLFPEFWRLQAQFEFPTIIGEQVASPDGLIWLAGVRASLEACGRTFGAADLCAAGARAPHIRQRLWWASNLRESIGLGIADSTGWHTGIVAAQGPRYGDTAEPASGTGGMGITSHPESQRFGSYGGEILPVETANGCDDPDPWAQFDILHCGDGKARRIEPGTFPLAHGVPARVGLLRGYGNTINPYIAAKFIKAVMQTQVN